MHDYVVEFTTAANEYLQDYSPVQLILASSVIYIILQWYLHMLRELKKEGVKAFLFRQIIKLPYVSTKLEALCIKEETNYIAKTKSLITGERKNQTLTHLLQNLGIILHRENARAILRRCAAFTHTSPSILAAAATLQSSAAEGAILP